MKKTGLRERRAQIILLVRAFEEADPEGLIVPLRERNKATRRALMVTGLSGDGAESASAWRIRNGEAIMRRARLLFDNLMRRQPALGRILALTQLGISTGPVVLIVAFVLGLLTNALGPEHRINLLALPLVGLLAWNLATYLVLLIWTATGKARSGAGPVDLFRGALRRRLNSSKIVTERETMESQIASKAIMRFGAMWHRLAGELLASRVKRLLSLAAVAMMTGVVVGMYLRGFAFEYRVTWESTWLDTAQMQRLMDVLLGPAAWVLRLGVPDVGPLRGPEGSGPAGSWIHLYAMTAMLVVFIPRSLMALYQAWRDIRLSHDLPLDLEDPYYRRLFAAWRGATRQVEIVPYSYTPGPGALATLKTLLFDHFGARAGLSVRDPVPYGGDAAGLTPVREEESEEQAIDASERCEVILFSIAQTPENDVHGEFLEEVVASLDPRRSQLLVVLDVSAYRARVLDAARVEERLGAWTHVIDAAGLTPLPIDLDRSGSPAGPAGQHTKNGAFEDALGALSAALWPDEDTVKAAN